MRHCSDRIVAAQEGAGLSVQARGKVHNAAWKAIMSPFFQEHILGMVREDMTALLATFEGECAAAEQEGRVADDKGDGDDEPPPVLQVARKTVGNAGGGAGAAARAAPRQGAAGAKEGGGKQARAGKAQPPPPAGAAGAVHASWAGLPESIAIVGGLGVDRDNASCNRCNTGGHRTFECPLTYAEICKEACPGFTMAGVKVAADWAGDELTEAARAKWVDYVARHGLRASRSARHRVSFS